MRRLVAIAILCALEPVGAGAQARPELVIEHPEGVMKTVDVSFARGYAVVPVDVIEDLGWSVAAVGDAVAVSIPSEVGISFKTDSPFFRWDGVPLQLADPPYVERGTRYIPLQLLTDFFPRRLPQWYDYDRQTGTLRAAEPDSRSDLSQRVGDGDADGLVEVVGAESVIARAGAAGPDEAFVDDGVRVVVIDAGHGGADPGALGPAGIREKSVALGISHELEKILVSRPGIEVHMIRDDDTFVDVWNRGQRATDLKGERPGIFISVHANSFPTRRATRGFETYFLAEARTEHERRVAAIENAPLSVQGQEVDASAQPDLDFILRELRNLDHQHWSALLAEMVQDELDEVHPGPNRGVKQGVLAVLTNALMPSVLVEVGYLSNEAEGRLLGDASFQAGAAASIAEAIDRFFDRYPPGSNALGGSGEGG